MPTSTHHNILGPIITFLFFLSLCGPVFCWSGTAGSPARRDCGPIFNGALFSAGGSAFKPTKGRPKHTNGLSTPSALVLNNFALATCDLFFFFGGFFRTSPPRAGNWLAEIDSLKESRNF